MACAPAPVPQASTLPPVKSEPIPAPPLYRVTYHSNVPGSTQVPEDSGEYEPGTPVAVKDPGSLARNQDHFDGWNTQADGSGVTYRPGQKFFMGQGDVDLWARWNYTIQYSPGPRTQGQPPVDTNFYEKGSLVVVGNQGTLVRAGHSFLGWNTKPDGSGANYTPGSSFVMIPRSLTLHAYWKGETRRVSFHSGDAQDLIRDQFFITDFPGTLEKNTFLRPGYIFMGWNTQAQGTGMLYGDGDSLTLEMEDLSLWAQWLPEKKVLKYTSNDGGNQEVHEVWEVDSTIQLLANPFHRSGYIFTGWNFTQDGSGTNYPEGSPYKMESSDTILYATWAADRRRVIFYANNGTEDLREQWVPVRSTATLESPNFYQDGYSFKGWNVKPEGNGTAYNPGATITMEVSDLVLYAQWNPNKNTITYYPNYGKGSMALQILDSGATANLRPNAFTRPGYLFNGWNTTADGSGPAFTDGQGFTMGPDRVVLYAQWIFPAQMISLLPGSLKTDRGLALIPGFKISNVKVTQSQYQKIMGTNPSYFSRIADAPNCPVDTVSWYDTLVYCNKLSVHDGLVPAYTIKGTTDTALWGPIPKGPDPLWDEVKLNSSATGYRLPTEAQWEYANRAGATTEYYWGNSNDYATVDQYAWYEENSRNTPHGVGQKLPNKWGLFDMTGNMYEWCWDQYEDPSLSEDQGNSSETLPQYRVQRGGSWSVSIYVMNASFRNFANPHYPSLTTGFRVIRL